MPHARATLPVHGSSREDILARMAALRQHDVHWREGQVFSLVFDGGDEVSALAREAYASFFGENGLNPTAFPSLRRFESDVISMVAGLLHGGEQAAGNLTTGGTESILMAVLAAREWARAQRPQIRIPEVVLPSTAHPAFDKAGHYFGLRVTRVPVREDFRADVAAMCAALSLDTVLLVGSAPSYPQGVVDPIEELAALAQERKILCHVDACVGGMMLPFVEQLGYPAPRFDFRVPGVTSLSVDLHKYGYAAKGTSLILYRERSLQRFQLYATTDWSGGVYASPTMTGTRPGGAIAAAWAVLNFMGVEGYLRLARTVMETTVRLRDGVHAVDGMGVLGKPDMSVMAITSTRDNVYEIGDELAARGWHLDRQQFPASLHMTVHYGHRDVAGRFLLDLAASVAAVRGRSLRRTGDRALVALANSAAAVLPKPWVSRLTSHASALFGGEAGQAQRSAALYGMIGSLPNRGDLRELALDLLQSFTNPQRP